MVGDESTVPSAPRGRLLRPRTEGKLQLALHEGEFAANTLDITIHMRMA